MVSVLATLLVAWATVTSPTAACRDIATMAWYEFTAEHNATDESQTMVLAGMCHILLPGMRVQVEATWYDGIVVMVNDDGDVIGYMHDFGLEYDRKGQP